MRKRMVPSWVAYALTLAVVAAGFFWATFFPAAPYGTLVQGCVALAGAYWVKRVADKKYNGGQNVDSSR